MNRIFARKNKPKSPDNYDSTSNPPEINEYHGDSDSSSGRGHERDVNRDSGESRSPRAPPPSALPKDRTNSGNLPSDSRNGAGSSPSLGEKSSAAHAHGNMPTGAKPKLVFHCQQAQGSPTGLISGFTSVKELYQKIAECYDMDASQILFCTLNTHKVDMGRLLGGQIGLDDFIFAHVKGQAKEIEIAKEDDALGLTITDNGAGYAFIKRIKEGSLMDKISHISVGDHIEKINGQSMVGCRHFEVARKLKDIPRGTTFTLRLVEPLKAGFAAIGPRSTKGAKQGSYGSGKATLRLRATGPATVEDAPDAVVTMVTEKINNLLESFLGINDIDLATNIWEIGQNKTNTHAFALALDGSELAAFGFTDDFVFDLWGIISDAKSGRIKTEKPNFEMQL